MISIEIYIFLLGGFGINLASLIILLTLFRKKILLKKELIICTISPFISAALIVFFKLTTSGQNIFVMIPSIYFVFTIYKAIRKVTEAGISMRVKIQFAFSCLILFVGTAWSYYICWISMHTGFMGASC